ncbi:MAG: hypothetical protein ACK5RG_11225 [Cyclobacteriaceae bacterium]|jgi:hypothetical protein|nr:hypothetical protein [Flammeovirgaceae bacterium]
MKKYIFVLAFLASSTFSFSQGFNWTFYSENGESFTLFIDSEKMNATPQPRVVASGIKGIFKTIRIEFDDTRIPKVTKRVPLKPGLKELVTVIKQNKKGEYILRNMDGTADEGEENPSADSENTNTQTADAEAPKEKTGFGKKLLQKTASIGKSVAKESNVTVTQNGQPVAVNASNQNTNESNAGSATAPTSNNAGPLTAKFDGQQISLSNGKTYIVKREKDASGMNGPQVIMKAPEGAAVTITQDGGKEVYNGEVPFVYTVKDWNYYNTYFKLEVTEGNQKWSVKMQNGTGYRFVIEQGSAATSTEEVAEETPASAPAQYGQSQSQYTQPAQNAAGMGQAYGANKGGTGTWTIYTEMGENFTAFLDGQKINNTPQASVTATVTGTSKQIRLEFEDKSIPKILKRYPIIAGETTIMVKQKKKGDYVFRVVSAPQGAAMPDAEEPAAAPAAASSGPLTAKYEDGSIRLSNGKTYTVTRSKDPSGMNGPQVIMKAPEGASVTITQDGGKEVYNGEVPFVYEVKDWNFYNTYFKLEVTEGNQKWSVKLQNGTGYRLTITE